MPLPCILAIDIDGTLLGSNGQVSPRNRVALNAAHAAGIEVVISTGRRHTYAMKVLRDLHLCEANALISSNGTVLRTVGAELIHHRHLSLDTARWLCDYVSDFRDALVFTFDNLGPDGEEKRGALVCEASHTPGSNIDGWMRANESSMAHVERLEDAFTARNFSHSAVALAQEEEEAGGPIQAMLCGTVTRMTAAEQQLSAHPRVAGIGEEEFPGCEIVLHRTSYPERDLSILDILPAGCSKASALEHLAALRGCTLADVVAIGDNWNDLPMLRAAGKAILMGNAPEALHTLAREEGWCIGPTNDEDGVAHAIEALLQTATEKQSFPNSTA